MDLARSSREPAVAGTFYPADPASLRREVARLVRSELPARDAVACLAPHAGYVYSGAIAGRTFAEVRVPRRAIVLCPNHTGRGAARSIWPEGAWRTPLGEVAVDAELAARVAHEAGLTPDRAAHLREHAGEVELPLLLRARERTMRSGDAPAAAGDPLSIVPVCLAGLSLAACTAIGEGLARAIGDEDVLIVASSDMSHYLPADTARALDELALNALVALEAEALYRTVALHDISMCGVVPATVAVVAARALGATRATLVRYGNSGEASGDFDRVVGYAGVTIER